MHLKRLLVVVGVVAGLVGQAWADVSITDRGVMLRRHRTRAEKIADKTGPSQAPKTSKRPRVGVMSTGEGQLVDASGLKYFINENITFSTSSSASGAMSEASFTHAVAASTLNGGVANSALNDAFDGYNTLCVTLNGAMATCQTGNANFVIFNKNGPVAATECNGRQIVFRTQTNGLPAGVQMSRKVYVPTDDSFGRWLNVFTNTGTTAQTFGAVIANNLGSDANTRIVSSSSGNAAAEITDLWVSTFQAYSGTTSSDPRLGHVLQGMGAATPLAGIYFADGDDNPWWGYSLTLQPGETKIIMNFVTGQPSKAAANVQAARLAALPPTALECMDAAELAAVANFSTAAAEPIPSLTPYGIAALATLLLAAAVWVLRSRAA